MKYFLFGFFIILSIALLMGCETHVTDNTQKPTTWIDCIMQGAPEVYTDTDAEILERRCSKYD